MFYSDANCTFKILGVYHFERKTPQDKRVNQRKHTTLAFHLKGESRFIYGTKEVAVSAGDVVYAPVNFQSYRHISTAKEMVVVHLQSFGDLKNEIEVVKNAAAAEPLFRKLLSVWESKDTTAYNRAVSILYSIFEALQALDANTTASVPATIQAGVALLQERYRDAGLRVCDLAKACFVSEVYFRNVFRRHFGRPPKKALDDLRFRYACDLLDSGYYTQTDVARLSGFEDVKFFRTAFRKHMGITPGNYKKSRG